MDKRIVAAVCVGRALCGLFESFNPWLGDRAGAAVHRNAAGGAARSLRSDLSVNPVRRSRRGDTGLQRQSADRGRSPAHLHRRGRRLDRLPLARRAMDRLRLHAQQRQQLDLSTKSRRPERHAIDERSRRRCLSPPSAPTENRSPSRARAAATGTCIRWTPTGATSCRLTSGPSQDLHPSFSPDGKRLVYAVDADTRRAVGTVDDRPRDRQAASMVGFGLFPTWCPDTSVDRIAFQRARQRGSRWFGVWTLDLVERAGDAHHGSRQQFSNAALVSPTWSPDGQAAGVRDDHESRRPPTLSAAGGRRISGPMNVRRRKSSTAYGRPRRERLAGVGAGRAGVFRQQPRRVRDDLVGVGGEGRRRLRSKPSIPATPAAMKAACRDASR